MNKYLKLHRLIFGHSDAEEPQNKLIYIQPRHIITLKSCSGKCDIKAYLHIQQTLKNILISLHPCLWPLDKYKSMFTNNKLAGLSGKHIWNLSILDFWISSPSVTDFASLELHAEQVANRWFIRACWPKMAAYCWWK